VPAHSTPGTAGIDRADAGAAPSGPTGPAQLKVTGAAGSVYTGLAIGSAGGNSYLYAANNALGRVDIIQGVGGTFTPLPNDPTKFATPAAVAAAGLKPFNVQNIGGQIYVTYSLPYPTLARTAPLGSGAVAVFNTDGSFVHLLTLGGSGNIASPWGITLAPPSFGTFANDLLVGNFSFVRSEINAFDPLTGAYLGTLSDSNGNAILDPGLWALTFGNGGSGGSIDTLYITAGIQGETHGLFAAITAIPEPSTAILFGIGGLTLVALRCSRTRRA